MIDTYTKEFVAMRYWLLGRMYFLALEALEYASNLHTGKRKDGKTKEYFHQLSIGRYVKSILTSLEYPEDTLATAFLHDVCEDYDVGFEEMMGVFTTYEKQRAYIQETEEYILPALKEARRRFPRQDPAYENIRHVLVSQIELLRAVHQAQEREDNK